MIIQLDLNKVNAYLIKENDKFMLIDCGGYIFADGKRMDNRRELLEQKLQEAGVTKENLQLLVLTHGDCDHSMNAAYIARTYDVPIAMHADDVILVDHPKTEVLEKTVNYRSFGMKLMAFFIGGLIKKLLKVVERDFESFTPNILLKDGDRLDSYGFSASVLHLPGHTPGSIGILTDDGDAIVGDAGPASPNAVDFTQFDASVKKLSLANIKMLYTGHMAPTEFKCHY